MTQSRLPYLTAHVESLPAVVPFIGPETLQRQTGRVFAARLGANEQRFGPSPMALAAMNATLGEAWMYGDPEGHDLRGALAAKHGCDAENIVLGEGVDALLGLIVRLCVAGGESVVQSRGTYPTFAYHVQGCGGQVIGVPYHKDTSDLQALAQAAQTHRPKLVYLANPDNPMGSHLGADQVLAFLNTLPQDCLLVLDEAYIDFAPAGTAPLIDPGDTRVIRLRSFSKSYGLAGLRLGYAICAAPLARAFDLLRNHFGLGRIVQAAGLAALQDAAHLARVLEGTQAARAQIAAICAQNGLRALPSATNFSCIDLGRDGDYARAVLARLAQAGIFIRMPISPPQDRCLRISHGTAQDLELLAQALPSALTSPP